MQLGLETVPCELADDLTDEEIRAYRLIDNELAKGESDLDLLEQELEDITTLDMNEFFDDIDDNFSIDNINDNMDVDEDENDYFTTKLTFPMGKKKQVLAWLREHKEDIVKEIIARSDK